MEIIIFLSSGLFLGWSLGANDAANVFGSAVGTKMVKFKTAAIIASIFIILGAGLSGSGAARTLGKLGSVNELAGAFIVALAAALSVYWMTKLDLPVSTSQAIVGASIGWNFFSGSLTDYSSLTKIVLTWILCPFLAAIFSMVLYKILKLIMNNIRMHLVKVDMYNRIGLILVGAFGAYSLGANNIANVMGVFVPNFPFSHLDLKLFDISGTEQLFIIGGVAIAVGVFTYSHKVMTTVGENILKLNPEAALIVVLSSSLVLFIFASEGLESFLHNNGLPTIPLVPVSSSQAVVGAILGIGVLKGLKNINYRLLGRIASGWVTTPIIACITSFIALFILQNVFNQDVFIQKQYIIKQEVINKLKKENIPIGPIRTITGKSFTNALEYKNYLENNFKIYNDNNIIQIVHYSCIQKIKIDLALLKKEVQEEWLSVDQLESLKKLQGMEFDYTWKFREALERMSLSWIKKEKNIKNKKYNRILERKVKYLERKFLR